MVVTNTGLTLIRDFLAGSAPNAPTRMLWGENTTSADITDSTMGGVLSDKAFTSTDSSVTRQVQWEGILLSTDVTQSTIRQVGIVDASFFTTMDTMDVTTGWNDNADAQIVLQTGSGKFQQGTASINLNKTGTATITASMQKTTSAGALTGSASGFYWFYVDTTTSLNALADPGLRTRLGSDASNYYEWTTAKSKFTTGWNVIDNFKTSNALTTTGTPINATMDYAFISFETTNSSVTSTSGQYIFDDVRIGEATPYIIEDVNAITKNNTFDLQTLIIAQAIRGGDV